MDNLAVTHTHTLSLTVTFSVNEQVIVISLPGRVGGEGD